MPGLLNLSASAVSKDKILIFRLKYKFNLKMVNIKSIFLALLTGFWGFTIAQTVPRPDHVIVLMMENYGYSNIIGNTNAPHINALLNDPHAALFTQSFGLTHPSQPNYIMLYSGDNQGISSDNIPTNAPFQTCNLGASLIDSGYTFKGYSEDLPSVGDLTSGSGYYVRRHCPWTNWLSSSGTNTLDPSVHQPYTSFPSSGNYDSLPTVSFVIPSLIDDMHNPTFPTLNYSSIAISNGDTWIYDHLTDYINWAKNNNSLLIITFDEDDGFSLGGFQTNSNQITSIFVGQMVQGGSYDTHINHYNVLRTLEDMYDLPYCGGSATVSPISNCWTTTGIESFRNEEAISVFPNPTAENLTLKFKSSSDQNVKIKVLDMLSQTMLDVTKEVRPGDNSLLLPINNLPAGTYVVNVTGVKGNWTKKIVVR
jgi:hypothetical protein